MTAPDQAPAKVTLHIKRRRREDPVHFIVRLVNEHDEPVDLYLRGREITFDVIVSRAKGPIVWQRLQGQDLYYVAVKFEHDWLIAFESISSNCFRRTNCHRQPRNMRIGNWPLVVSYFDLWRR